MSDLNIIEKLQQSESSLCNLVLTYKANIMKRASDDIVSMSPEKQDQFLQRTIMSIVQNENLKECFNSPEGRYSIFELIDECVKTGLILNKHAYAVPYGKKVKKDKADVWVKCADFQIRDRGFHALLCGGSQPIFNDLRYGVVYEKEKNNVEINRGNGEVIHKECIDTDKGKPIGVWVQAVKLEGSKEVEFYPISYIYNIRNNHSIPYQRYIKKEISTCAWVTDEIPMIIKTAIKAFCKPYADVKDALAYAYYFEKDEVVDVRENVETFAEKIIDTAKISFDTESVVVEEKNIEEKPVEEKNKKLF
jgi:recombinational DNA repair protein RecT